MKRILSVSSLFFMAVFITGCEDKTSTEWYVKNHPEMLEKYKECLNKRSFNLPECINARTALHSEMNKEDVRKGYGKIINDLSEPKGKLDLESVFSAEPGEVKK